VHEYLPYAGLLGGLVSSTTVAFSMADRSRESKAVCNSCASAISASNSVTFLRTIFVAAVLNLALVDSLMYPLLAMFTVSAAGAAYFLESSRERAGKVKLSTPLALAPALKFGGLFVLVLFVSKLASVYFGDLGVFAASAASGLMSVDAVLLSISTLEGASLSTGAASFAIFLACLAGTASKAVIAYWRGTRDLALKTTVVSALTMAAGVAVFLVS